MVLSHPFGWLRDSTLVAIPVFSPPKKDFLHLRHGPKINFSIFTAYIPTSMYVFSCFIVILNVSMASLPSL